MRKLFILLVVGVPLLVQSQIDSTRFSPSDSLFSPSDSIPFTAPDQSQNLIDSLISGLPGKDELNKQRQENLKKDSDFQSEVKYSARDSSILDVKNNILYLYGDVTVTYEDIQLKAPIIWIDFNEQTLYAKEGEKGK